MEKVLLEMKNICKEFSGNPVLKSVNIQVFEGEVHVLVGENGAGKSTLLKILSGLLQKDFGEIYFDSEKVEILNTKHAQNIGISMIHDEVTLFPNMSIAENIFLGEEPYVKMTRIIDNARMNKETNELLKCYNLDYPPHTLVKDVSINNQKVIEIIRVLKRKPRLILMDELTASFNDQEVNMLFNLIHELKQSGCTIIYVSHRMEELQRVGDRITVLRDGQNVVTEQIPSLDTGRLIKAVAGEKIKDRYPKINIKIGEKILRVENLNYRHLKNISFSVNRREIVGIAGLRGSGASTLTKALFGAYSDFSGDIYLDGKRLSLTSTETAVKNGIAYITQNRTTEAFFPNMGVYENVSLVNLKKFEDKLLLNKKKEREVIDQYIKEIGVKNFHRVSSVSELSSGNQKKLLLARWIFSVSELFIFNEPTASIDIASKVDIYNLINELLRNDCSIILNSSDFQELIEICDRILIMYEGRIVKELHRSSFNKEEIMFYAFGSASRDKPSDNI